MYRSVRLCRRALVLALGAVLLVAGPASAHPFIPGGQAPVDSLADLRLTMSHGCGTEDAGGGDPTMEVAMEVAEDMRIVAAPDVEDYEVVLERDTDGRIEVVTWTAAGVGVPAPELPFSVVFSGAPGTETYLKVFQGCEDFTYRWVGTSDEPAEDPAVRLELVAADPASPAPPPEEAPDADTAAPDATDDADADGPDATDGEGDGTPDAGDGSGGDGTGSAPVEDASDEDAGPSPDDDPTDADAPTTDGRTEGQTAAAPSNGGPGTAMLVGVALFVLLALVVGGIVIGRRSGRARAGGAPDA